MDNCGYTIIASSKYEDDTIASYIGTVPRDKVYKKYSDAVKRKKELMSYRSAHAKREGITNIILKVIDNKIIGK